MNDPFIFPGAGVQASSCQRTGGIQIRPGVSAFVSEASDDGRAPATCRASHPPSINEPDPFSLFFSLEKTPDPFIFPSRITQDQRIEGYH